MSLRWMAAFWAPLVCLAAGSNETVFRERILPVLAQHCAKCHGGAEPASGLSVGSLDALMAGGKHGVALTPGHSSDSLLVQYLRGEKSPRMPLGGALPDALVQELAAAIDRMQPLAAPLPPNAYAEWLLHQPKAPAVPEVRRKDWVRNPIDAFVLAKLEARGLAPAPRAAPGTLVRRLYFDLIGLPPPPEEVQAFEQYPTPEAYEKLIDKLLADPRYGERWARHWLDLARFAESDGFAIDGERPTAWRYRDYVIRAFNQDKPYDLFVKEQLAGDELDDKGSKGEHRSERLVALGFLRMATWEADANFKTQLRLDVLNEITATTSTVFLGLTAGCARCHDHKYDPIPQRDFYRLEAFFAATRVDDRAAPFLEAENPKLMRRLERQYEDEADAAAEELKKIEEPLKKTASKDFLKTIKDPKDATFTAAERQAWQAASDRARRTGEAIARYRPVAYAVSDVVPPQVFAVADTYVLGGGELANKGEKVEPGFPVCLAGRSENARIPFAGGSSGRRLALAEWIASPLNPLTARVMVNRIWQHHFGEGIVRTPSDFGLNGERPSHPELLDWLALQFVEKKWSMKAMHKLMLLSNTWQQSTEHPQAKAFAEIDPRNQLLWRRNWSRLEAEVLRDSILSLSGRLQVAHGGPGVFLDIPADVAEGFEFFKWFPSPERDQLRRSIYTFQRRSVMMPLVEVFDGANMSESCARRHVTTVAPQAFTLLNGELTNRESRYFADRVVELAGPDRDRQIDRAFRLVLGRPPSADETRQARQAPLVQLGVVLFNLNEFVYLE